MSKPLKMVLVREVVAEYGECLYVNGRKWGEDDGMTHWVERIEHASRGHAITVRHVAVGHSSGFPLMLKDAVREKTASRRTGLCPHGVAPEYCGDCLEWPIQNSANGYNEQLPSVNQDG
jgi:hypothetical protein